jgi:molecular chaperone DnaK
MKSAVSSKDVNKINETEAAINEVWQAVSQRVYSQNQQQNDTAQQPNDFDSATASTEDVQDADFEEVK